MSDIFLVGQTLPADALNQWIQAGEAGATFTNSTVAFADVVFDHAFAEPPVVVATVNSGATPTGSAAIYACRAQAVTTTGCRIHVNRTESDTNLNATVPVGWVAVGRPDVPIT